MYENDGTYAGVLLKSYELKELNPSNMIHQTMDEWKWLK